MEFGRITSLPPVKVVYDADRMHGPFYRAAIQAAYDGILKANRLVSDDRVVDVSGDRIGGVPLRACIQETKRRQSLSSLPVGLTVASTVGMHAFFEVLTEYALNAQRASYACVVREHLFDEVKGEIILGAGTFLKGTIISSDQILSRDERKRRSAPAFFRFVMGHEAGHELGLAQHCESSDCMMNPQAINSAPDFSENIFCTDCIAHLSRFSK